MHGASAEAFPPSESGKYDNRKNDRSRPGSRVNSQDTFFISFIISHIFKLFFYKGILSKLINFNTQLNFLFLVHKFNLFFISLKEFIEIRNFNKKKKECQSIYFIESNKSISKIKLYRIENSSPRPNIETSFASK